MSNAFDPAIGFQVASKRCNECLYTKRTIVSPDRRAEVLAECKREGSYFICHKATLGGRAVVCRGFYDAAQNDEPNQMCQVAARLGLTVFVEVA